jgi:hypothetical protein
MFDTTILGMPVELPLPADANADLANAWRPAALDALRTSPEVVRVTLRRELGGRWWDITLGCNYWQLADRDATQRTLFTWDAEWANLDGQPTPPPWHGCGTFDSPAAALADATATLERAGVGPVIASIGPRR